LNPIGKNADVYRPDDRSKLFHSKVTRTANALDPATRTLLAQIAVPNPDDALRPGMYLLVKFAAVRTASVIVSAALVGRADEQPAWPVGIATNERPTIGIANHFVLADGGANPKWSSYDAANSNAVPRAIQFGWTIGIPASAAFHPRSRPIAKHA
jgi:hypothetical protein